MDSRCVPERARRRTLHSEGIQTSTRTKFRWSPQLKRMARSVSWSARLVSLLVFIRDKVEFPVVLAAKCDTDKRRDVRTYACIFRVSVCVASLLSGQILQTRWICRMQKSKQHRKRVLRALGAAIRNRRVDLELTQEQLGGAVELHRTYVTDIEGGLRNLSFLTLMRLAQGLECSLSELIGDAESLNGFHK